MTLKMFGAASVAILLVATSAQAAPKKAATAPTAATPAAAAAPAPAQPPLVSGPPITGICLYNRDAAVGASSAGKSMLQRMQQLRAQAAAEIQAEQQAVKTDADALIAKRTTLTQEQFQQQAAPIQQRQEATQRKAELRNQELEATGEKALQRFDVGITPILRALYQAHNCSLLLRGDVVMGANPQMDLTELAVQQMNTAMPSMTFDRETLPQQQR
jgi:Skp family chaperone for outer membrane proteins